MRDWGGVSAMHATEWIAAHAKYKRTISAVALRVGLKRDVGHCTWCDRKFSASKVARWCSANCRQQGYIRFGGWYGPVTDRDKGVCAMCGQFGNGCEIDHIIPVIEGGGCCGLDNLRTLCLACHRRQTAGLAKRRSEERHDAKRPLLI